ncbi:hypothetical protein P280DRAFT_455817 [Massarina eburnea CBS 473.64]|uniref:DUF3445 domain-containing protein n=1 Tax=Massarina eburnea CBS 473.64 TaxID=1395130 RepID=A0A6A6RW41_9PLEO|nr:hypothetical protein P280DRAFT_455817 [Massarina eburnea CBS 473.64]
MLTLTLIILLSIAVVVYRFIVINSSLQNHHDHAFGDAKAPTNTTGQPTIEPLPNFNFAETAPLPYRPFQNKRHVAIGITKMPKSEWIRMDKGYLARIEQRKQVMREHGNEAVGCGPLVDPAIEELFQEIMVDYLPKRYPTMFSLRGTTLHNKATGGHYQVDIKDHATMLRYLGENVEEDFYIMCPDEEDEIRLQGYIGCFPGGFLPSSRIGQSMREIHAPVPGFEERIGKGADRALKRLEPENFIERFNWSLQTDGPDLFRVDGNNFYPEQGQSALLLQQIIIDNCWLRVEHQTLCRLPKTRAVIFCVRSYMTTLHDIKAEGNGPLLADAFESMPHKLGDYKKTPFWGETVYRFLRS